MELYTVWKNFFGVGEKCLLSENGDYIGKDSGLTYSGETHNHSEQIKGKIVSVDKENQTGMLHLSEGFNGREANKFSWKSKYIGCYVTLEGAHYCDGKKVYRCLELDEYFSEDEIELI